MSLTYTSIIVAVLASVLPKAGIMIGTDELTTTISVLVTIAAGITALYGRYRAGGISALGFRK